MSKQKQNEQGHIWLDKVKAYVCPSYLNETKTDFSDEDSEYFYKLYQKHYGSRVKRKYYWLL